MVNDNTLINKNLLNNNHEKYFSIDDKNHISHISILIIVLNYNLYSITQMHIFFKLSDKTL